MVRRTAALTSWILLLPLLLSLGCPTDHDDDDDSTGTGGLTISGVEIADNEASVLSCWVRWTTDVAATSRVEFGDGDAPAFFVDDDALVTEHELLVFGLRSETTYTLLPISVSEDGDEARAAAVEYTTAPLPFEALVFDLGAYDPDLAQPGWLLINIVLADGLCPAVAAMVDMQGELVWYHHLGDEHGRADVATHLVDDAHVLIGAGVPGGTRSVEVDLAGRVVWEGPEQPDNGLWAAGQTHHVFEKLPGGSYLTFYYEHEGDSFDRIVEMDANLQTLWEWRGIDHLPVQMEGYPWGNGVALDHDEGTLLYNSREYSAVVKVDRADGQVLWTFGRDFGDFTMLTAHDDPWPEGAHAPELLPDGHLMLYDNGYPTRRTSRVVEYALNEDTMTAELVWEYPGELAEDPWFTESWGDVDLLDNGNVLVNASSKYDDNSRTRIFEVTREGEVVHELLGAMPEDRLGGSYLAERIPVLVGEI